MDPNADTYRMNERGRGENIGKERIEQKKREEEEDRRRRGWEIGREGEKGRGEYSIR